MKTSEQDDLLSRLASKAKRKLNKTNDEEVSKTQKVGVYEFAKSERKNERVKLEKKITQLLKTHADCEDPIGKLIDHSIYDKLSDERKQAYILRLSEEYREILSKTKLPL